MLRQITFKIDRSVLMAATDCAILAEHEDDACVALVNAVVQSIWTEVEVEAGGVKMHLAAWQDPEHWESDWAAKGIDDPRAFIESLVVPYDRPLLGARPEAT